jgi:branched-chain amino acid aminotransferase
LYARDETLAENDLYNAYIRLSITRGRHAGKLTPPAEIDPTLVIIASDLPHGGQKGSPVWDGPADVDIVDTIRIPDKAMPAAAKTHNHLNGILARLETDVDEVLMLDCEGTLAAGATRNLIFYTDGTLKTPSIDGSVLPGITLETVLELASELNIPTEIGTWTPEELYRADEAFLTNTTWELRPIACVGDIRIDQGAIFDRLDEMFDAHIETLHY